MKEQVLKRITKITLALLIFSILVSFDGCAKEAESGNSLKNIQLTEEERKWVNPDEKYEDLLLVYGKKNAKAHLLLQQMMILFVCTPRMQRKRTERLSNPRIRFMI